MRLAARLAMVSAAVVVSSGSALAATPLAHQGVLSMQPARRTLVGTPPQALSQTRVANSTQVTMKITVFPTLLIQDLDGSFSFNEDPRDLNAAKLQFPVEPTHFVLKPGQTTYLHPRWQLLPQGAKEAALGLVVQGVPMEKGKGVSTILRLLGINYFTLPGRWTVSGRLTGLRGQQSAPGVLRFLPRVKNTGQVHSQPRNGHCKVVRSGDGSVVLSGLKYGTGDAVVLPGYEREYPILIQKPHVLPAGSYMLRCSQRFGKTLSTRNLPFRLSGPNTLPTASLKLVSVSGSGEIGGSASVGSVVRNVGSKPSTAVLKVELDRLPAGAAPKLVARATFPQGSIAAGATKKPSESIGHDLTRGNYRVTVVLTDGHTAIDEKTADFAATKHRGFFDRAKDKWWWLLILLAILLIVWLLWRQRRKQQELEEELAQARQGYVPVPERAPTPAAPTQRAVSPPPSRPVSPPPPPPASRPVSPPAPEPASPAPAAEPTTRGGRIDVNTASVDELIQLPGVGRRAAERIVAYREAHGPFASLDDLHQVEGWHAERIKRIADQATV